MSLLHGIALFAAALAPQDPPLVDVPEGWAHERLRFPLSFAPGLDYRGFEDLSFAPGMFDPGADSYFSYALGLRLEGDVEVDERMLANFLTVYYRGLYVSVAEGKDFDRDASTIGATVRRDGERFQAEVRTFDSFTNGAPLALSLQLEVHCTPRATEVLGLASPKPADAPIWKQLSAIGDAWRAARPTSVFLNHVYVVVDRETYDALAGSKFLRETFAVNEVRATRRADVSYSGLYFYGRSTYFEFLPPESAAGLAEGNCGLALGVERAGALDALRARLAAAKLAAQGGPITRELDGVQVPWFEILGIEMPASPLNVLALEYEPEFLARWHPELPPAAHGIARSDVLARYAAALGRAQLHAAAPFLDVARVELAAGEAEQARLSEIARVAGWDLEPGPPAVLRGPRFSVLLRPSTAAGGVTAIELALRGPVEREALQLGRATVRFSGRTARIELRR
jgi:hypothetical protein